MAESSKFTEKQSIEVGKRPINAWRHYGASIFQMYLIGAVAIFTILAVLAKTVAYFAFDVTITHAVQTFNPGWFDGLMNALSWIGFAPQQWIIALVVLLFLFASGHKWAAVRFWDSVLSL